MSINFDPDHGIADFSFPRPTAYGHPQCGPVVGYAPAASYGAWLMAARAAQIRDPPQSSVANYPVVDYLANWLHALVHESAEAIRDHGTDAAPITRVVFIGAWGGFGVASRMPSLARKPPEPKSEKAVIKQKPGFERLTADEKRQIIVKRALGMVGKDYVSGGGGEDGPTTDSSHKGKAGFDCNHLVIYAYAGVGMSIPEGTFRQRELGSSVGLNDLLPGDLVFTSPHHVGIYIGGGQVVEAPGKGKQVQTMDLDWFTSHGKHFTTARHIIN